MLVLSKRVGELTGAGGKPPAGYITFRSDGTVVVCAHVMEIRCTERRSGYIGAGGRCGRKQRNREDAACTRRGLPRMNAPSDTLGFKSRSK